jgi:hypothetical protein
MALSNIFREPRREITESVVGTLVIVPFFVADWYLSCWLQAVDAKPPAPFILLMVFGAMVILVGIGLLVLLLGITHTFGEAVCEALENRGLHLRPRDRYRNRDW